MTIRRGISGQHQQNGQRSDPQEIREPRKAVYGREGASGVVPNECRRSQDGGRPQSMHLHSRAIAETHTGPYHNGQCSPGFAVSLSAPDTTNADNVLAIAKRATSGDTVAPLSRTCTQVDSVSGQRHAD
jgi:hypothetical protein